ncbi:Rieske (2Fe-2S) protein [Thiolapillus sp.]
MAVLVCRLGDLQEKDARGFQVDTPGGMSQALVVVRQQDRVWVYLNRCPHTGVNLEWQPDRFFDLEGRFLQCATHGALFRPEDGYCVRGPCAGDSLESLPVQVENGQVFVSL